MCTRALWHVAGQPVLVGRNMDWKQSLRTNLWALPGGVERTGIDDRDPNPLRWQARFGSVAATAYDQATTDGINERGLGVHLLWLAEADFGERDTRLPALSVAMWAQWFLDRFATVAEAVAALNDDPIQVRPQHDPHSDTFSTVHLALDDATGDSAIIEHIAGQPRIHHGRDYTIMTNSPPFDQQRAHLHRYEGFGGTLPLPGTTEAADRFVRASYYLDRLPPVDTTGAAYAALLSVMRNAAQPFGTPDPARPNISMTIWRSLADLTHRVYAFESTYSPNIIWTRLDALDLTHTARLDLSTPDLVGDVSHRYTPATEPAFASA